MTRRCALLAAAGWLLAAGCDAPSGEAPSSQPAAPAAVPVRPFPLGEPDAVLLFTGGTDGMLEVCDCVTTAPGGLSARSGLAISYRAAFPRVLLLDIGDALVGTDTMLGTEPPGLRNRMVLEGYRSLEYDAMVLAAREWELPFDELARLLEGGTTVFLSTTIDPAGGPELPLRRALLRQWGAVRVAVVSCIRPEDLPWLPRERTEHLRFDPARAAELAESFKREGYVVVAVVYGDEAAVEQAVAAVPADLFVRGWTAVTEERASRVAGKWVLKVGGAEAVGVAAIKVSEGRIVDLSYRREILGSDWPIDRRFRRLYRRFLDEVREAARRQRAASSAPAASTAPAAPGQGG